MDATTALLTLKTDAAVENATTAIGGNIKLKKIGTGTFTSSKALTYTGDTEVAAGTIQATLSTAAYNAAFTPFGTGKITVNSNATFNAQSTVAYRNNVILNGGTVMGGAGNGGSRPVVMLERVTADSAINQARAAIDIGAAGVTTDLNGHTVTVTIAAETYFRWYGSLDGVEGKLRVEGYGFFNDFADITGRSMVDIDIGCAVNFGGPVHVRDFKAANRDEHYGTGAMNGIYVSGTYTPVGNYYFGCVLQNGATLDISGRELPFPLSSWLVFVQNGTDEQKLARKTVRFDSGATVTVKIDPSITSDPAVKEGIQVVSWDDTNKPGSGVKFVLDDELSSKYKLSPRNDGLLLRRHQGLIIYVR